MTQIFHIHCGCGPQRRRSGRIDFAFGLPTLKEKVQAMAEMTINRTQKILCTLTPLTDEVPPKPAKVDGKPIWSIQSGGDSTFEVAEDGLSAFLVSSDTPGDTVYLIEADADLGEGVETIRGMVLLHVVDVRAANLGIGFGEPVPKAPAPPS